MTQAYAIVKDSSRNRATSNQIPSTFALVPYAEKAPASYGVQLYGGVFHEMIRWDTRLPCTVSETFETAADYISRGSITVACSQSPFDPPKPLARVELEGIQIAQAGVPKAKITVHLDEHLKGEMTMIDTVTRAYGKCSFNGDPSSSRLL